MNDIRFRYGLLLATAILPFVMFFQAYFAHKLHSTTQAANLLNAATWVQHSVANPEEQDIRETIDSVASHADANITVIGPDGRIEQGSESDKIESLLDAHKNNEGQLQTHLDYKTASGRQRTAVIVTDKNSGTHIIASEPSVSMWSWQDTKPFSKALTPLLAWLGILAVIWFATDQFLVTHLRQIFKASSAYESGDQSIRVGRLQSPPSALRALGQNFDKMADDISQREAALIDALDEKETLLREIHHRVKNNLQIIISLLNMQERKLEKGSDGFLAINDTRSRINAIALVHRGLYESEDLRYIDMKQFIQRMMSELKVAMGLDDRSADLNIEVDCGPMEADTAIPVALFFVEGLTNAVKHSGSQNNKITVALNQTEEGTHASVSNFGPSLASNPEAPKPAGTGTRIIDGIARQLGGSVTRINENGLYRVTLKFTSDANNSKNK